MIKFVYCLMLDCTDNCTYYTQDLLSVHTSKSSAEKRRDKIIEQSEQYNRAKSLLDKRIMTLNSNYYTAQVKSNNPQIIDSLERKINETSFILKELNEKTPDECKGFFDNYDFEIIEKEVFD